MAKSTTPRTAPAGTARIAIFCAVVCRTDPRKNAQESLAVIMVPGNAPGVKVTGILDTTGHRATISPRMKFENVRVPAGNIIGKPGDGIEIVSTNFAWTAALIGAFGCAMIDGSCK
jgi:nitroalkane oxidase